MRSNQMIGDVLIVTFLMVTLIAAILVIPAYMVRRATLRVISTFCGYEALEPSKARDREEMGLKPPDFLERMLKPRDYKPHALHFLNRAGIVRSTEDGRLYMVQDKLSDELKCTQEHIDGR
jgi:hypothetical protein